MQIALFRAIAESRLGKNYKRQTSIRIPSNIPYVVDNLWEWLRPEHAPSRRHAVYASPTPELALANASAPLQPGEHYVACHVVVAADAIRVAHLQVRDAREHGDIRMISQWLSRNSSAITEAPLEVRRNMAMLFLPGLHRSELEELRQSNLLAQQLCEHVQQHSTFWQSASATPTLSEGELFFELIDDRVVYQLEPYQIYAGEQ